MIIKFNKKFFQALCLLMIAVMMVLQSAGNTGAIFSDLEKSPANNFLAGAAAFDLAAGPNADPNQCYQEFERSIVLSNLANALRYRIKTATTTGDLCAFATLAVYDNAATTTDPVCAGDLIGFECDPIFELNASSTAAWTIKTGFKENAPINAACDFDLMFDAWQARHMEIAGGYHLAKTVSTSLSTAACAPKLIINKVYYAPDCAHNSDCCGGVVQNEWKNEWIELYNPQDRDISLKDWILCDNAVCHRILEEKNIPAKGFALVSRDPITWTLWDIAGATTTLITQLSGDPVNMTLSNVADMLQLKDPFGNLQDQMNWGVPNVGWANYDPSLWNPGAPAAPRGHYLGRKPSGYDTDQVADWFDYASPIVNITGVGSTTWVYGRTYNVTWTASNPGGLDSDLRIDLIYYKDTNSNGYVDPADQIVEIARGLPNTGSYAVKVVGDLGYYGYVWVKLIARNVENFMVQAQKYSPRIFEPESDEIPKPDLEDIDPNAPETSTTTDDGDDDIYNASSTTASPASAPEPATAETIAPLEAPAILPEEQTQTLTGTEESAGEIQTQEPPAGDTPEAGASEIPSAPENIVETPPTPTETPAPAIEPAPASEPIADPAPAE